MYTFVINDDNTLIKTRTENIIQGTSNINYIRILVKKDYKTINETLDMSTFDVLVQCVTPITRTHILISVKPNNRLFNEEYLEYTIPITTELTKEFGDLQLLVTFTKNILDEENNVTKEYKRITETSAIKITKSPTWDEYLSGKHTIEVSPINYPDNPTEEEPTIEPTNPEDNPAENPTNPEDNPSENPTNPEGGESGGGNNNEGSEQNNGESEGTVTPPTEPIIDDEF